MNTPVSSRTPRTPFTPGTPRQVAQQEAELEMAIHDSIPDPLAENPFDEAHSFLSKIDISNQGILDEYARVKTYKMDDVVVDPGQETWKGELLPYTDRTVQNHESLIRAWYAKNYKCPAHGCRRKIPGCGKGHPGRYRDFLDHWYSIYMQFRIEFICPFPECEQHYITGKSLTAHYSSHFGEDQLPSSHEDQRSFLRHSETTIREEYKKLVGPEIDMSKGLGIPRPPQEKKRSKKSMEKKVMKSTKPHTVSVRPQSPFSGEEVKPSLTFLTSTPLQIDLTSAKGEDQTAVKSEQPIEQFRSDITEGITPGCPINLDSDSPPTTPTFIQRYGDNGQENDDDELHMTLLNEESDVCTVTISQTTVTDSILDALPSQVPVTITPITSVITTPATNCADITMVEKPEEISTMVEKPEEISTMMEKPEEISTMVEKPEEISTMVSTANNAAMPTEEVMEVSMVTAAENTEQESSHNQINGSGSRKEEQQSRKRRSTSPSHHSRAKSPRTSHHSRHSNSRSERNGSKSRSSRSSTHYSHSYYNSRRTSNQSCSLIQKSSEATNPGDVGIQAQVPPAQPAPYKIYSWAVVLNTPKSSYEIGYEATQQLAGGLADVRGKLSSLLVSKLDEFTYERGVDGWVRTKTVDDLDALCDNFLSLRSELDAAAEALGRYRKQLIGKHSRDTHLILVNKEQHYKKKRENTELDKLNRELKGTIRSRNAELEGLRKELLALRGEKLTQPLKPFISTGQVTNTTKEKASNLDPSLTMPKTNQPPTVMPTLPHTLPPAELGMDPLGPRVWTRQCTESQRAQILAGLAATYQHVYKMF